MSRSLKSTLVVAALALLSGVAVAVWSGWVGGSKAPVGALAWTLEGQAKPLKNYYGQRTTLVNFWATSCSACVAETPKLIEFYQRHRHLGFELVGVAMSYDNPDFVRRFQQDKAVPYPLVWDKNDELAIGFGQIRVTPTSLLLNAQGQVIAHWIGEPDMAELARLVQQAKS